MTTACDAKSQWSTLDTIWTFLSASDKGGSERASVLARAIIEHTE
jgi:hypothetical protein